jgi:hypothetical protein
MILLSRMGFLGWGRCVGFENATPKSRFACPRGWIAEGPEDYVQRMYPVSMRI